MKKKNKTREYALKYRKKLIEIIIFVKKKFQWLRLKRKILRKKNYLFKFIYFFPFANNKENQKRMKILINLETLLCLLLFGKLSQSIVSRL